MHPHDMCMLLLLTVGGASAAPSPLQNALTRIKARNAYLCTTNTDTSSWNLGGTPRFQERPLKDGAVMSLFAPVYDCPWTLERTNFVSEFNFDGGKWTCGVSEMRQSGRPCVVYSFGSNADSAFEDGVRRTNPACEIHIFDPTSKPPPRFREKEYSFHEMGLCSEQTKANGRLTMKCDTLSSIMRTLNHTHVDILKADVEGEEYSFFTSEPWHRHASAVGQILLEVHLFMRSAMRLPAFLRSLRPLERAGFFVQTLEPVSALGTAYEMSFLNVNWFPVDRKPHIRPRLYVPSMYPADAPCPLYPPVGSPGEEIFCGYPAGRTNYSCDCGVQLDDTDECAVSLVEQRSRSPCAYGVSYGCYPGEPTRIWTRGCRGKFRCPVGTPIAPIPIAGAAEVHVYLGSPGGNPQGTTAASPSH